MVAITIKAEDAPRFRDLMSGAQAHQPAENRQPVTPEETQQRRSRADMQHHQEGQEVLALNVEVPSEQRWQHHGMAKAADGKQFGRALDNGNRYRVNRIHWQPSR